MSAIDRMTKPQLEWVFRVVAWNCYLGAFLIVEGPWYWRIAAIGLVRLGSTFIWKMD